LNTQNAVVLKAQEETMNNDSGTERGEGMDWSYLE
jgi:hypothetical protein